MRKSKPDYEITDHAQMRMSQRAVRNKDIGLALKYGTQIAPNVYFMQNADARREIDNLRREFREIARTSKDGGRKQKIERALKRKIQRLERLRGLKVVVAGDAVLTSYRPSLAYQKRARRGRRVVRHAR